MRLWVVGLAVTLFLIAQSAALAAPFSNGGFESGALSPWTVTQGSVIVWTGNYCCGLTGAAEGSYLSVFSSGANSLSTIAQTFDTTAGQLYEFSFLYSRAGAGTDQMLVAFADSATPAVPLYSQALNLPPGGTWRSFTGFFEAVGSSSIVSFTNTLPNGSSDAALDAVALRLAPEPGAVAMLLGLGMTGVLGYLWRRRRG